MDKLTAKEAKLVAGIVSGKTKKQAAKDAGYAGDGAGLSVNTSKVLKRPNVQEALQAEFIKQNITLGRIVKPISDALDASKIVTSPTEPDKEVPDHGIRLKASGMAAQFLGINKNQEGGASIHFHAHVAEQREKYGI